MRNLERAVLLQIIDERWREHLLRHGLPARGHPPARLRAARPAGRVQERGLHALPRPDELDLGGLRPLHLPRRGRDRAGAGEHGAAALVADPARRRASPTPAAAPSSRRRSTTRPSRAASRRRPTDGEEFAALPEVETRHVDEQRQDRPQRPVLVRLGQEVQEVPRRVVAEQARPQLERPSSAWPSSATS